MKSSDASGDGLSASSARTQSRQRTEQNLLADFRGCRQALPGSVRWSASACKSWA